MIEDGHVFNADLPATFVKNVRMATAAELVEAESEHNKVSSKTEENEGNRHVASWTPEEVLQWLTNKDLNKLVPHFQKYQVTGKDLTELNLPFITGNELTHVEDREILLSEIYTLLNPTTVFASEEDLTRISSPTDKQKYLAAVELAQRKSMSLPRSCSVFTLPSQNAIGKSASMTRGCAAAKPRHKSESGIERYSHTGGKLENLDFTKKRRIATKKKTPQPKPVYDCVQWFGPQCIQCVTLTSEQRDAVGVSSNTDHHALITSVPELLADRIRIGDRVLEINGQLVKPPQNADDSSQYTSQLLQLRTPAKLVLLTERNKSEPAGGYEEKWQRLQSMLVEMRDSDAPIPPSSPCPISPTQGPTSHQQLLSQATCMQEEIQRLRGKLEASEQESQELMAELEDREALIHDLELSRDKAIEKLQQKRSPNKAAGSRESVGGAEYFNLTIDSLGLEEKNKDEVIDSLKDIVMEASKQKWYLDRLISLVIEESPWLLDEVDSEFDHLTLSEKSEEFC